MSFTGIFQPSHMCIQQFSSYYGVKSFQLSINKSVLQIRFQNWVYELKRECIRKKCK